MVGSVSAIRRRYQELSPVLDERGRRRFAATEARAYMDNERGVKIKLQVSMRERPVLPIHPMPQLALDHFNLLEFAPVEIPCLAFEEEVVAEKIRAAA